MIQFRGLHTQLRPYADYAVKLANQYGLHPQITSVLRDMQLQAKLRKNYETCLARGEFPSDKSYGPNLSCRWPANRPGDSGHNYGLAWDSWVPEDEMPLWVQIREYVGWRVAPNDVIHAELPNWRSYLG